MQRRKVGSTQKAQIVDIFNRLAGFICNPLKVWTQNIEYGFLQACAMQTLLILNLSTEFVNHTGDKQYRRWLVISCRVFVAIAKAQRSFIPIMVLGLFPCNFFHQQDTKAQDCSPLPSIYIDRRVSVQISCLSAQPYNHVAVTTRSNRIGSDQ